MFSWSGSTLKVCVVIVVTVVIMSYFCAGQRGSDRTISWRASYTKWPRTSAVHSWRFYCHGWKVV